MRPWPLLRLSSLLLLTGCTAGKATQRAIDADHSAIPPNTAMLSQMMRELSAQPGFTEQLLGYLDKGQQNGALLTPELFDTFRTLVLGKDWSGLDRFPGWTIRRITRTVEVGEGMIRKDAQPAQSDTLKVQIGPYAMDRAASESLDVPSNRPGFSDQGLITKLTDSVTNGDGADPKLAPLHAESTRLAEVMNRLALNGYKTTEPFAVTLQGQTATTPQQLVQALAASGHQVVVADARYFANFGHFHFNGEDVEMPFFLNSGYLIPTDHWWQRARPLLVPVAHAEYEWIVTGPKINADITFYFGIDGRAEFRTNDQLNQAWVMGRHAHEYRDADAVEVTRLTGQMLRTYAYLHAAHPQLPFGGYYTLGVCQDVVGAIEMHMTGKTTLFPNTAQTGYFADQPDAEITRLMEAVPKDTGGAIPVPDRIFGSLPTDNMAAITVPGLRDDLLRSKAAADADKLHGRFTLNGQALTIGGAILASAVIFGLLRYRRRRW
ncbi:MAG: hypothetical protein ACRYF4_03125 [Janthinobacterium lividum]